MKPYNKYTPKKKRHSAINQFLVLTLLEKKNHARKLGLPQNPLRTSNNNVSSSCAPKTAGVMKRSACYAPDPCLNTRFGLYPRSSV